VAKSKKASGGPEDGKNKGQGDLFKYAEAIALHAEAIARKFGATASDFCTGSIGFSTLVVTICVSAWWNAFSVAEGYELRRLLFAASIISGVSCGLAVLVFMLRNHIHNGATIILQSLLFVTSGTAFAVMLGSGVHFDAEQVTRREQQQEQVRQKRLAEQEAGRQAEEKCKADRLENIEKAKRAQRLARGELEICKAEFSKTFQPFKSAEEVCKQQISKVESAGGRLESAMKQVSSTASVGK
jgi:hypothetical protein